jgi:hypothetical protein
MTTRSATTALILISFVACSGPQIRSGESAADYAARLASDHEAAYVVERLRALGSNEGDDLPIGEDELIGTGYWLLMNGKIEEAFVIQQASVELFPASARAWDNLGTAAIYMGDRQTAQTSLERSLELDSTSSARWTLPRLDAEMREAAQETRIVSQFEPGASTGLQGPYLGQATPGLTPQVFAPGIVSTRGGHEFSCTFSTDGKEFYFNRGFNIYVSYWRDAGWTAPAPAAFNSDALDHEPHISADNRFLYFGSGRPRAGLAGENSYGIWVMERTAEGWDAPEFLFPGMYVTTARNGNAYVTDIFGASGGGICVYRHVDGQYGSCERLSGGANLYRSAHPLISADERFLVFDAYGPNTVGGEGDDDFYISVRLENGSWSEPAHLKEISTPGSNMTASLSPDGRFLFYYANHDIYWVSAAILEPYIASSGNAEP